MKSVSIESRAVQITWATSYGYDPDGNQIARTTDGSTTLYLGTDTITVGTAGTVTKVVRELPFAGGMLAVRKATTSSKATATDALHWQAANSQGSGITDITADTLTITRRGFTPYGQTRTGAGSGPGWTGQHGFVGGLIDTTDGYTTLGARLYDPDLGSFLSVDPVFDPADPGSWNGYGYADANPVDNADPSGQTCTTTTAEAGMGDAGTVCGQTNSGSSPNESNSSGYDTGWSAGSSTSDAGSPISAVQITPHVAAVTSGVNVSALTRMFYDTYPDATWGSYHHLAADQQVTSIAMLWYNACKLHQDVCTPQLTKGFWHLKTFGVATQSGGLGNNDIIIGAGTAGIVSVVGAARFTADGPTSEDEASTELADTDSEGVSLSLRYKEGWSDEQRAAADLKVQSLNDAAIRGELRTTPVTRGGTAASVRFKAAGNDIPEGSDVDHTIDLQLGGTDDITNMSPLDLSVNRSLGSQIQAQLRYVPAGTCITGVSIC